MNILKFSAKWCQPCKQLSAVLADMDLSKHELDEFDIDNEDDMIIAAKYRVRSVPTLIFLDDEGNELARTTGVETKEQILYTIGLAEAIIG